MTSGELKDKVEQAVQDASFSGGILALFNRCLGQVAARAAREERILPNLEGTDTVTATADASSVALPSDYGRGLYWCGSALKKGRVKEHLNFTSFLRRWPDPALDQAGQIQDVAVKGPSLYYQPRSADTLTLHYYKNPTAITTTTQEITEIPEHMQESLLVNFACREIFNLIEPEGQKTSTKLYAALYQQAEDALMLELDGREEAGYVEDCQ